MAIVSSQDFRNLYEKFYDKIRRYLWPIETLKVLANIEECIYSAFINYDDLDRYLTKIKSDIRDTMKEDEYLAKAYNDLVDLFNEAKGDNASKYLDLARVEEVNPESNKQLKYSESEEDNKDEDNKETVRRGK